MDIVDGEIVVEMLVSDLSFERIKRLNSYEIGLVKPIFIVFKDYKVVLVRLERTCKLDVIDQKTIKLDTVINKIVQILGLL